MADKKDKALQMLATALNMEKKGREFYEKALEKSGHKLGREIFTKLRDDEMVHEKRIIQLAGNIKGGKPWSRDWKNLKTSADLNAMFKDMAKKEGSEITVETSDIEALDVGITFESRSIEFYQERLKEATDPLQQEFIEKMIVEEKSHYELLVDMKYYLTDPAGWFAEQEKIHIDGA